MHSLAGRDFLIPTHASIDRSVGLVVFSSLQGKLSDVYGRKPILVLAYAGPALGYLMMGVSSSLWIMVLARVVLGEQL